jgi:hypothetical protein
VICQAFEAPENEGSIDAALTGRRNEERLSRNTLPEGKHEACAHRPLLTLPAAAPRRLGAPRHSVSPPIPTIKHHALVFCMRQVPDCREIARGVNAPPDKLDELSPLSLILATPLTLRGRLIYYMTALS